MSEKKKLFLVDVMAMAFRSYYAFINRPLSTAAGFPTSAIYGSALILTKILREEKPDYLVFASDSPEKTFRHGILPSYKAHRSEMPDSLSPQIPILYQMIELLQVPVIKIPGMEADDILASLTHRFAGPDLHAYIVGRDKDFMQLVNQDVSLFAPTKTGGFETLGSEQVMQIMGCMPGQIVDYLSMLGDASDNVPGVKGIGKTSAVKLLTTYGSLESIYANLDKIANKRQQDCLREGQESAKLAQKLITLKSDIHLPFDLEAMRCHGSAVLSSPAVIDFFTRFEFGTLVKRLTTKPDSLILGSKPDSLILERETIGTKPDSLKLEKPDSLILPKGEVADALVRELEMRRYHLVQNPDGLARCLEKIAASDVIAFDTETTGLNIVSDFPIGVSFTTSDHHSYYLPLIETHLKGLSRADTLTAIKKILEAPEQTKIAHNIKFDLQMLKNLGIEVRGPLQDTMLMAFLLESTRPSFGIDALALSQLGFKKVPTSDLIGKKGEIRMSDVPLQKLYYYACEDTDVCMALAQLFLPQLQKNSLMPLFEKCEMPLAPILGKIEQTGIYVDGETLASLAERFSKERRDLELAIYAMVGSEFNLNSPKQLGEILFEKLALHEKMGLKRVKKTKNGFSTDVSVLEQMKAHPLIQKILDYRLVNKLQNTYVETLPQIINDNTHRVHTSFHQCGTATGRLSSTGPNLQNIPIRSDKGREIRAAFAAEAGNIIVSADYSQIELRLLAHLSKDEALCESFRLGKDIHSATASKMFKKPIEEVSATDRSRAKAINFGIIYGMGASRLAQSTGVTNKEAKEFIDQYFKAYPKIRFYLDSNVEQAKACGYATTMLGRRRPIAGLDGSLGGLVQANAKNIAVNSPLQGSAADLIKMAMIHIDEKLRQSGLKGRLLLQVHDELVFECPEDEKDELCALVKEAMESALILDVPLKVDCGSGRNWLSAH